jgi:hypothetical protein
MRLLLLPARGESDDRRTGSLERLLVAGVALSFGVVAIAVYATQVPGGRTAFAAALLFAGAALLAGGVVGVLFGIPRQASRDPDDPAAEADGPPRLRGTSTHLEQVSGWLTKVLIGVLLAQLGAFTGGANRLFEAMAPSLGGQPSSAAFAGAIVVFFSACGFLAGWLATRVLLDPAPRVVHERALDRFVRAQRAEESGDRAGASRLRQEALAVIERQAVHPNGRTL